MVVVCPNCQTRLKLTRLPCAQCKNPIEVDQNRVPGKPGLICPHCQAHQVIGRLKCTKCQTMINLVSPPQPPAPTSAPQAPPPRAAAPVAAEAPAADPPAPAEPPPPPEAPAAPAAAGDVPVFRNSPGLVLVLSCVTFGLYLLYWAPKAAEVINAITTGKKIGPVMAILAGLACCAPALIKFYWRSAVALGLSRVLMVLLAFFPPIAAMVVQSNINKLYEERS